MMMTLDCPQITGKLQVKKKTKHNTGTLLTIMVCGEQNAHQQKQQHWKHQHIKKAKNNNKSLWIDWWCSFRRQTNKQNTGDPTPCLHWMTASKPPRQRGRCCGASRRGWAPAFPARPRACREPSSPSPGACGGRTGRQAAGSQTVRRSAGPRWSGGGGDERWVLVTFTTGSTWPAVWLHYIWFNTYALEHINKEGKWTFPQFTLYLIFLCAHAQL